MGTNDNETRETLAPSVTAGELISALEGMADACRGAAGAVRVHSTPHGSVFGVPVQPADQDVVRSVLRLADVLAEQAGVSTSPSGHAASSSLDGDPSRGGDANLDLSPADGLDGDPSACPCRCGLQVGDESLGGVVVHLVHVAVDGDSHCSHGASPSLGGGAHSVGAGGAAGASVREVPAVDPSVLADAIAEQLAAMSSERRKPVA